MSVDSTQLWTYDLDKAISVQENLRHHVVLTWDDRPVETIAGIDVGYTGYFTQAAIAVLHYPHLEPAASSIGSAPLDFPYVAGYLAFRVGPAILDAWEKLSPKPDLLLIHGHGIAHPRGLGLASHVGLWLNVPVIGVAKSKLYGLQSEPGPNQGDWSELLDEHDPKRIIGAVLRTQANARPLYVSAGHLIDLPHSIAFVQASCRHYRLPEPIRLAHKLAASS